MPCFVCDAVISHAERVGVDGRRGMNDNIIIFGSGGVNSAAYVGVCRHLEEINILPDRVKHVVGCSGGALVGLLVCCKYTWKDMIRVCLELDASVRFDCFLGAYETMGIDSMDGIREVLARSCASLKTMKDVYDNTGVRFTCYATNICTGKLHKFDSLDTPDVSIVDAVCASMCVPFVFSPVVIGDAMFIDGAVLCAMPPNPFRSDDDSVRVISAKTVGPTNDVVGSVSMPSNAVELAKQLVSIMLTIANEATAMTMAMTQQDDDDDDDKSCHIDIHVDDDGIFLADGTFLSIDEPRIAKLIHTGYRKAKEVCI